MAMDVLFSETPLKMLGPVSAQVQHSQTLSHMLTFMSSWLLRVLDPEIPDMPVILLLRLCQRGRTTCSSACLDRFQIRNNSALESYWEALESDAEASESVLIPRPFVQLRFFPDLRVLVADQPKGTPPKVNVPIQETRNRGSGKLRSSARLALCILDIFWRMSWHLEHLTQFVRDPRSSTMWLETFQENQSQMGIYFHPRLTRFFPA